MTLSTIKIPTFEQLREVATELGMSFSDEDLGQHLAALRSSFAAYNIVDQMPDEKLVHQNHRRRRRIGQAQGQEDCTQGQYLFGRRAHDERCLDT